MVPGLPSQHQALAEASVPLQAPEHLHNLAAFWLLGLLNNSGASPIYNNRLVGL